MNEGCTGKPGQQAPNPNPEIFTGNIKNFEQPKFNARQESAKMFQEEVWLQSSLKEAL